MLNTASKGDNAQTLLYYINGELKQTQKFSYLTPIKLNAFTVGGDLTAKDRNFMGVISEMRLWKTARTQKQIQYNAYAGVVKDFSSDLIGQWIFNGTMAGNAIYDRTSNKNNGVI